MRRRGVRVTLAFIWLAALAAAGYGVLVAEREAEVAAAARAAYEQDASRAAVAIVELESAERAAVAAGQRAEFWLARATATRQDLDRRLARLGASTAAPEAQRAIQQAAAVLRDFDGLERRAREYLALDQPLFASDLIFADGRGMLSAVARYVETARTDQRVHADQQLAGLRNRQALIAASLTAATVLVVLLLLPAGTSRRPAAAKPPAAELPAGKAVEPPRAATQVDLQATAALCAELACVTGTRELPALMARAANILGATGVVLWVADQTAGALVPAIAHGYPPDMVARLGSVRRDADNATAVAFRAGRTRVVAGSPGTAGALIAPLVTARGCTGVMAAELPHPREQDAAVRAVAEIFAAQLATLVSPSQTAAAPAKSAPASA